MVSDVHLDELLPVASRHHSDAAPGVIGAVAVIPACRGEPGHTVKPESCQGADD
jgi:hypothetical protein